MLNFAGQLIHLFAAMLLLISFAMLSQRRGVVLVNMVGLQGLGVAGRTHARGLDV